MDNELFMLRNKLIFILIMISFIPTIVSSKVKSMQPSTKLIIDTDAGADDAMAISLILSAWDKGFSDYEVVAITSTFGNTKEENVEQNILKTLTVNNASHIPVYGGAQRAPMEPYKTDHFFGDDGFGDFEFEDEIKGEIDNSTHAAVALVNLARKYNENLCILTLGPLTNIAMAIGLDPNFVNNVEKFFIMGGSVAGVGNRSPGVEFNFGSDPDSTLMVFKELGNKKPAALFPWETTLNSQIPKEWRINVLGEVNSPIINFLNKAERVSLRKAKIWKPADVMTAAYMLFPSLARKTVVTNVTPVNDGAARGSLLVDYTYKTGKNNNTEVIQEFDSEEFKKRIFLLFSDEPVQRIKSN